MVHDIKRLESFSEIGIHNIFLTFHQSLANKAFMYI